MSTWLKLLPLELQEIDPVEPTGEVKRGETVVGVVSEDLRKLWTMYVMTLKAAELLQVELKYTTATHSPELIAQERGRVNELMFKARALETLFWIGALDELDLWGHPEQNALRTGWQVVEFTKPESLFNHLFGGPRP